MITTKLVIPELSEDEIDEHFVDKEDRHPPTSTPADTEKDDIDAPSTTAVGSESRGEYLDASRSGYFRLSSGHRQHGREAL